MDESESVSADVRRDTAPNTVTISDIAPRLLSLVGYGHQFEVVAGELPPLTQFNAVALYSTPDQARDAIVRLEHHGVDGSRVSYVALRRQEPALPSADEPEPVRVNRIDQREVRASLRSAALGAVIGAVVGGLIGFIAAAVASGLSTTVVVASTAAAAAFGALLGGLWGAFARSAVSPAWHRTFDPIEGGVSFVGVHVDARTDAARAARALEATRVWLVDADGREIESSRG